MNKYLTKFARLGYNKDKTPTRLYITLWVIGMICFALTIIGVVLHKLKLI